MFTIVSDPEQDLAVIALDKQPLHPVFTDDDARAVGLVTAREVAEQVAMFFQRIPDVLTRNLNPALPVRESYPVTLAAIYSDMQRGRQAHMLEHFTQSRASLEMFHEAAVRGVLDQFVADYSAFLATPDVIAATAARSNRDKAQLYEDAVKDSHWDLAGAKERAKDALAESVQEYSAWAPREARDAASAGAEAGRSVFAAWCDASRSIQGMRDDEQSLGVKIASVRRVLLREERHPDYIAQYLDQAFGPAAYSLDVNRALIAATGRAWGELDHGLQALGEVEGWRKDGLAPDTAAQTILTRLGVKQQPPMPPLPQPRPASATRAVRA
ncbi:hypothetical protein [Oleiharenicola sp. Vm1]|uniref:hypothetical protein n=1 Tax=Oleiharenicola sp. Vm1 TaxID=3398393 RepID=UPI0039F47C8B